MDKLNYQTKELLEKIFNEIGEDLNGFLYYNKELK